MPAISTGLEVLSLGEKERVLVALLKNSMQLHLISAVRSVVSNSHLEYCLKWEGHGV